MNAGDWKVILNHLLGRGVFPHQMSRIIELPWRRLLLSPQKLLARLPLNSESHVLEVGAGAGFYSVEVARRISAGQLQLLDLQPEMLKKAQQKVGVEGLLNTGYTVADAGKLPFKEHSFDLVFLVTVLGEITAQDEFLMETYRVLKPDGILSISEHFPDIDFSPLNEVVSLVEAKGFRFLESYGVKRNYTANFRKLNATP